jgi:hypothetical protein
MNWAGQRLAAVAIGAVAVAVVRCRLTHASLCCCAAAAVHSPMPHCVFECARERACGVRVCVCVCACSCACACACVWVRVCVSAHVRAPCSTACQAPDGNRGRGAGRLGAEDSARRRRARWKCGAARREGGPPRCLNACHSLVQTACLAALASQLASRRPGGALPGSLLPGTAAPDPAVHAAKEALSRVKKNWGVTLMESRC